MKLPLTYLIAKTVFFVFLLFYFTTPINAQLTKEDSVFYANAVNNTVALYHQTLGDQSRLYNGSEYPNYPYKFKEGGHPFFQTPEPRIGFIVYDHVLYTDVALLFDEVAGVVVFQDGPRRTQLHSDWVSRFSLFNHTFMRIVKDSVRGLVSTGFYEVLYEGKVCLLKREKKAVNDKIASFTEGALRFIDVKTFDFIKKDNAYFVIKKRKDALNVFKDRKKDIQEFIKNNHLSFSNDRDNWLLKVTAFYDQLTK